VQCDTGVRTVGRRRLQKENLLLIGSCQIIHLGLFITPPSEIWRYFSFPLFKSCVAFCPHECHGREACEKKEKEHFCS